MELGLSSADILIGGIPVHSFPNYTASMPYVQSELTWCVSRAKPIPVWLNLWQIASRTIWCLAVVTVFLEGSVLYLLMRFEHGHAELVKKDFHYCVLLMASVFTGMSHFTYRSKSKQLNSFICLMLMTGILISTAWNCFLIKVLTSPAYYKQISTVEELIENDFHLIGSVDGKDLMLLQPTKVYVELCE